MQKVKGFRVGQRFRNILKWIITRKQSEFKSKSKCRSSYVRLSTTTGSLKKDKSSTKLCSWIDSLKQGAKRLCFSKTRSGYIRVGQDPEETQPGYWVPRGHLAIYVGEKKDDACRVLVPLMYFNHPLFEKLLKEAEKMYGFDHPGGIQIPCRVSEFESVKTKIAAARGGGNMQLRRSWKRI
ncbi:Auxin-responsive protein saur36 [Heracleum sosnowskyi]|uniref:Auxin-responsive protein saur36 n=1 Tax=Heracleum sosnowskyi TaxID=360622 RepID=A0AAD8ID91_9APIA|nr:Auxin-responsive protein saur36 [Heracleum sosnowskyi]